MNVTKHARERWEQRVNPKAGENAEEQIRQAFTNAEYIWCDEGALYYANSDHWIFVVDEQKKNIITVFEIDYGFPSDINRTIANELISKMGELRVEVERVKNESNLVVDGLVGQINILESERGQLINQTNLVTSRIKALEEEKRVAEQEVKNVEYEMEKLLKQLVRSDLYRKGAR